jgi:hypothetical protein
MSQIINPMVTKAIAPSLTANTDGHVGIGILVAVS